MADWVVADWVVADWVVADWVVADWVVADWVVADWVVADWVVAGMRCGESDSDASLGVACETEKITAQHSTEQSRVQSRAECMQRQNNRVQGERLSERESE